PGVDAPPGIARRAHEAVLDRRVDVLVLGLDPEVAAPRLAEDLAEAARDRPVVGGREEPALEELARVGERAPAVLLHEPAIDLGVVADGVREDLGVEGRAFLPEPGHAPI